MSSGTWIDDRRMQKGTMNTDQLIINVERKVEIEMKNDWQPIQTSILTSLQNSLFVDR